MIFGKKLRYGFAGWMAGFILTNLCIAAEIEEGFVSLFNGKNLDGWTIEGGDARTFFVSNQLLYSPGENSYPAWLRSEKEYENFDLRFDFRMVGWCNSGVFFEAPLHGRNSQIGFEFQIDHKNKEPISIKSCGAIFASVPPKQVPIGESGSWNTGRILMDWPYLKAWINDVLVQDLNVEERDDLKYRLRRGYIGLQDMGYQVWYRNIHIKELPPKIEWRSLFNGKNFDGWRPEGPAGAKWSVIDGVIRAENGTNYMVTQEEFEDFELHLYFRTKKNSNGGVFIRWKTLEGGDRGNEIQIENNPDSDYPTGSLYNIVRAEQAPFRDEEWLPLQIRLKGAHLVVRVNGEKVVDCDAFPTMRSGHISLQMHMRDSWIEFKDIKIRKI
ncbi:MAG: DUF1080 domain-containing protein [Candidatus Omnitrophota bacterium]